MSQSGNYLPNIPTFGGTDGAFSISCQYCGRILMGGEGYYQRNGKPYCEECVESADLEDLIRICETDTYDLYQSIGLRHNFVVGDL